MKSLGSVDWLYCKCSSCVRDQKFVAKFVFKGKDLLVFAVLLSCFYRRLNKASISNHLAYHILIILIMVFKILFVMNETKD